MYLFAITITTENEKVGYVVEAGSFDEARDRVGEAHQGNGRLTIQELGKQTDADPFVWKTWYTIPRKKEDWEL